MKEEALRLGRDHSLIGILTENTTASLNKKNCLTGVLLLNAGVLHHVGPSRLYVKIARRLAGEGFVVIRFDFSGLGDSGPRRDKMPATESVIDEVGQVMDYLESSKGIRRFCCVGLCAGAASAARVCLTDPRIRNLILINPLLPKSQQTFLIKQSNIYFKYAIFRVWNWIRFFSFKSNYRYVWQVVVAMIKRRVAPSLFRDSETQDISNELKKFFKTFRAQRKKMLMVYSELESVEIYFQMVVGAEYNAMKDSGQVRTEKLLGADHLVTPLSCQEKVIDLISNFLTENA